MMDYPLYFNSEGVPGRIMAADATPEIYAGNGQWKPYADRFDLMHSPQITESESADLCASFDVHTEAT